jgi:hypothetical protein
MHETYGFLGTLSRYKPLPASLEPFPPRGSQALGGAQ